MRSKRPLRFSDMTPSVWRKFESAQFERDYARYLDEQERGDAARDAREKAQEVEDE